MAGGFQWRLISKADNADFYQKVEDGPWYMRKGITYTIRMKVRGAHIPIGPGDQGTATSILSFTAGDTQVTRTMSTQLICKSDSLDDLGEGQTYLMRTQVWEWKDKNETEVFNAP